LTASEWWDGTAVRATSDGWVGDIDPGWNIGRNPNGGYTLAIAARAMLEASGRPDPLTVTAHYVAPPQVGEVTIRVETVRAGRRYATLSADMTQGDKDLIRVIGAFGDLDAMEGPTRVAAAPPPLPAPERCVDLVTMTEAAGLPLAEVMRRYEVRLDPTSQWVQVRRGEDGPQLNPVDAVPDPLEVTGWMRFADGTEPSVLGLLAMADAFPPTMLGHQKVSWIPTMEFTVHVRARPAPGWIAGVIRTRFLIDGLLEEDGELWDSDGRLVALSRQMALVLPSRRAGGDAARPG
jgi:acyl-CoA thioesterase